ncbi:MAG: flagellar basal body rod protein FlgB [Cellvibrionales bacterium]|nr:MAG: flagellar basal body rod protein FlgB [Cellvibrionales bacterium]
MQGWVQSAIGGHAQALMTYSRRAEILASNLANADTPGYKARDVDFRSVLAATAPGSMFNTDKRHISSGGSRAGNELLYRSPYQSSLDGNTVETHVEQAAFADNAIRYQASIRFLSGSIKSILLAIKGE